MKNLKALLEQVGTETFRVTTTANGVEKIQQTERNTLRTRIMEALALDLQEAFEYVGRNEDGVLLEVANQSIANGISRDSVGSGAITLAFDVKVKDLDTDLEYLTEVYTENQAVKAQAKAERAAKAKRKREKDEARRAKSTT